MAKHRLERVNELIRRELGDLLRKEVVFDAQLVTVQQVDVTPDLKHAHIYMSVIGTQEQGKHVIHQLQSKRAQLQYLLSRRVIIKYTPQLHFKLDEGIERGTRVIHLMDEQNLLPQTEEEDEFGNPKLPENLP